MSQTKDIKFDFDFGIVAQILLKFRRAIFVNGELLVEDNRCKLCRKKLNANCVRVGKAVAKVIFNETSLVHIYTHSNACKSKVILMHDYAHFNFTCHA